MLEARCLHNKSPFACAQRFVLFCFVGLGVREPVFTHSRGRDTHFRIHHRKCSRGMTCVCGESATSPCVFSVSCVHSALLFAQQIARSILLSSRRRQGKKSETPEAAFITLRKVASWEKGKRWCKKKQSTSTASRPKKVVEIRDVKSGRSVFGEALS